MFGPIKHPRYEPSRLAMCSLILLEITRNVLSTTRSMYVQLANISCGCENTVIGFVELARHST